MLFAHLKRILKLDRLRLRGMSGARDEFLLAATRPESTPDGQAAESTATDPGGYCACIMANHPD
jgi:hypothetical protein